VRRALVAAVVAAGAVLAACSEEGGAVSGFDRVSLANPRDLPISLGSREGEPGPNGGTVFEPISDTIEMGAPYRYSLGHCGLSSPVDIDGSFWDPVGGVSASGAELDLVNDGEMINATSGLIVVIGDEMRFRTASGAVVSFTRHEGAKEFPGCD
jgi:hypothetical protein